jgi:AcrR family transcriptional regulator
MSPRTKEQFQDIREERKNQIIDAALEVFAEYGYHKSSISQIAKEAKISKGLMYNYFQNKEELLVEVMRDGIQYLLRSFIEYTNEPAQIQLRNMIVNSFDFMDEDYKHWRLYFSTMMQMDVQQIVMSKIMETAIPVFQNLAQIFAELGFNDSLNEARYFAAMLDGLGMNYLMDAKSFPKQYCINRLCEIYKLK